MTSEHQQIQLRVRQAERIAILIDGWNFARMCQAVNLEVDFERLLTFLVGPGVLVRAVYFLGEVGKAEQESFLRKVRTLGYTVVTKPMKRYVNRKPDGTEETVTRCDFGVEFVLAAMQLARRVDRIYFVTSDADYVPLMKSLQNEGVRLVLVASTERVDMKGRQALAVAGTELVESVDEFVELKSIRSEIGKPYRGEWGDDNR